MKESGSHWACCYQESKRPRNVGTGSIMYMGRLVGGPNDTIIYGRAVALRHREGRDEATEADITKRDWKEHWPIYVRGHHAEFVDGDLRQGVKLSELMDALGAEAFVSTQLALRMSASRSRIATA